MTDYDVKTAWLILEGKFKPNKPGRFISGCAVTFNVGNSKGKVLQARGLEDLKLPLPLLVEHNWLQPCGLVTSVRAVGDELKFVAEVVNDDSFYLSQVWSDVILSHKSVGISASTPSVRLDGKFEQWRLAEISIVGSPSDAGAEVQKVWECLPYVSLTEPAALVLRC